MRLPFNPSRVDSSGKPDHSRGLHPGLFYSTLSASVLWVMLEPFRRTWATQYLAAGIGIGVAIGVDVRYR